MAFRRSRQYVRRNRPSRETSVIFTPPNVQWSASNLNVQPSVAPTPRWIFAREMVFLFCSTVLISALSFTHGPSSVAFVQASMFSSSFSVSALEKNSTAPANDVWTISPVSSFFSSGFINQEKNSWRIAISPAIFGHTGRARISRPCDSAFWITSTSCLLVLPTRIVFSPNTISVSRSVYGASFSSSSFASALICLRSFRVRRPSLSARASASICSIMARRMDATIFR